MPALSPPTEPEVPEKSSGVLSGPRCRATLQKTLQKADPAVSTSADRLPRALERDAGRVAGYSPKKCSGAVFSADFGNFVAPPNTHRRVVESPPEARPC